MLVIILLVIFSVNLHAQLVINEGSNKNFNFILDEDDESEDWIEIYNSGSDTINLDGYSLTDDKNDLHKWTFSSYYIEPGDQCFRISSELF